MKLLFLLALGISSAYAGTVTCLNNSGDPTLIQNSMNAGGTTTITGTCAIGTQVMTIPSNVTVTGTATLNYTGGGYIFQSAGNNSTVTGLTLNGGGINLNANSGSTASGWQSGWNITTNTFRNITSGANGISVDNIIGNGNHSSFSNNTFFNIWSNGYPNLGANGASNHAIYIGMGIDNLLIDGNHCSETNGNCLKGFTGGFPSTSVHYVAHNVVISNNDSQLSNRIGIEFNGTGCFGACDYSFDSYPDLVVKGNYWHNPPPGFGDVYAFSLMWGAGPIGGYYNNSGIVDQTNCGIRPGIGIENDMWGGTLQGNVMTSVSLSCSPGGWAAYEVSGYTQPSTNTFQNNIYCGVNVNASQPDASEGYDNATNVQRYEAGIVSGSCPTASGITPAFTSANNQTFPSGGNGTWTATVKSNLSIRNVSFYLDGGASPAVFQEISDVSTTFTSDQKWHYHALINTNTLSAGTHTIKAIATDVSGAAATPITQTFTVGSATCSITSVSPLASGATGVAYSQFLASSACPTSTWAITSGSLPTGLSLNTSTGAITGTPSAAGTFTFTVTYATASPVSLSITIITTPPCSVTTTSPLPAGTAGTSYTQMLAESSCTGSWSVTSGLLPPGITLDSVTGALTGIPTTAATYGFTAAYGAGSAALSLTIQTPGAVIYDNGNLGAYFSTTTATNSIPITLATGAPAVGHLLYGATAFSQYGVARTITSPGSFWNLIDNSTQANVSAANWWRTVRSGDTAGAYTWTLSGASNDWESGVLLEIVGAQTVTPVNGHSQAAISGSASWAAPSLTPTINGTLAIVTITTEDGTFKGQSITSTPAGWTLAAQAISQYRGTFVFVQNAPSAGTAPVTFSATTALSNDGLISMTLLNPQTTSPFTVTCTPIPLSGGTSTCNATQSVTWSVNSGPGTVSPSSGISTTYTQALGIAAASVVGGCMTTPNDSVYNTIISGTALSPNSAAYITNSSHTYPITFGAAWGVNIVDNTLPPSPRQFHYTTAYNTANGFSWNPLNGPAIVENASMPGFTGYDGGDHHQVVLNHQSCQFQEFYQNNNWNADGAASENARSGEQYYGTGYALPTNGTTDASGQCLECITLRAPEILSHSVNHALRFTTNQGYMDSSKTVWPATGGSGSAGTTLAPYGSRFRLKSSYTVSPCGSECLAIVATLKNEGMILADAASYPGINQIQVSPDVTNCPLCAAALAQITAAAIPITQFDVVDDSTIIGPLGTAYSQVSTAAAGSNAAVIRAVSSGGGGGSSPVATYGSGINADTKANLQVHPSQNTKVSHRFRASTTSTVTSVTFSQRGGPVYSGGTGGTIQCTVQTDDGTANHFPSGTILATASFVPGNPAGTWETYQACAFSSPPALTAGSLYHIVYTNTDLSPDTNWISVNQIYCYGTTLVPQEPHFSDTDYAVLANTGSWAIQPNVTAPLDVAYANGVHDGQAYYATIVGSYGLITGTSSMVREQFTVAGGNQTVTAAYVRVGKQTGSGALTITLETGTGTLIENGTVLASAIAITTPGADASAGNWVGITFATSHVLTNGQTYNLRLSAPSGTQFSMVPIRSGADIGYHSYAFSSGTGQLTTDGTTWSNLYLYSPENTQFYFTLSN